MVKKYNEIPVKDNMKVEVDNNQEAVAPKEKKQLTKIVDVQPKKVKRNLFTRLVNGVLGPDGLPSIGAYVNDEIIKPAIKNIIYDAITSGLSRTLYGNSVPPRGGHHHIPHRQTHRPVTQYDKQYRNNEPAQERRVVRASHTVDDYVIPDRFTAVNVLSTLTEAADRYDVVSVADYYDLIGIDAKYTDHNYGWRIDTITSATIVATHGGFIIKFPRVEEI